ncbi:MAG: hypothetical protein ACYC2T_11850 [Bacillota bacterium]
MKVVYLALAFFRDHFRTTATLVEVIFVVAFLSFFFGAGLKESPPTWHDLALATNLVSFALVGLATSILVWRNTDSKMILLMLKAGRPVYYLALSLAALLVTFFWLLVIVLVYVAVYMLLSIPLTPPAHPGALVVTVAGNVLVVVGPFILFSALTGKTREPAYASILVLASFGADKIAGMGNAWSWVNWLLPPILSNTQLANGTGTIYMVLIQSLAYFAVLTALGLLRLYRREFTES